MILNLIGWFVWFAFVFYLLCWVFFCCFYFDLFDLAARLRLLVVVDCVDCLFVGCCSYTLWGWYKTGFKLIWLCVICWISFCVFGFGYCWFWPFYSGVFGLYGLLFKCWILLFAVICFLFWVFYWFIVVTFDVQIVLVIAWVEMVVLELVCFGLGGLLVCAYTLLYW